MWKDLFADFLLIDLVRKSECRRLSLQQVFHKIIPALFHKVTVIAKPVTGIGKQQQIKILVSFYQGFT